MATGQVICVSSLGLRLGDWMLGGAWSPNFSLIVNPLPPKLKAFLCLNPFFTPGRVRRARAKETVICHSWYLKRAKMSEKIHRTEAIKRFCMECMGYDGWLGVTNCGIGPNGTDERPGRIKKTMSEEHRARLLKGRSRTQEMC